MLSHPYESKTFGKTEQPITPLKLILSSPTPKCQKAFLFYGLVKNLHIKDP